MQRKADDPPFHIHRTRENEQSRSSLLSASQKRSLKVRERDGLAPITLPRPPWEKPAEEPA